MKNPSQEDLLGYVLGALDAEQQSQVQQLIESNPQLEEQLGEIKSSISPLEHLGSPVSKRAGLARRTIEAMAVVQNAEQANYGEPSEQKIQAPSNNTNTVTPEDAVLPKLGEAQTPISFKGAGFSFTDAMVAVAACVVLAALIFPAITYSRDQVKLQMCQSNLQTMGVAFQTFSNMNEGCFPKIPLEGNMATTGGFAPMLKEANLIADSDLVCAGVSRDGALVIPTVAQINSCSDSQLLERYRRQMSGDYGYSLGYMENDNHVGPRNLGRSHRIILADSPSANMQGRRSANHGGKGQNCLFEDGHWEFVKGHAIGDDAIYENEYGVVAPGVDSADNVIGASHLSSSHFSIID